MARRCEKRPSNLRVAVVDFIYELTGTPDVQIFGATEKLQNLCKEPSGRP